MGKYKVYHIPEKKIGCTINLIERVEKTQGFKPGEYEVVFETDDVKEASDMEIKLQKKFGYKKDRTPYHKLHRRKKRMHTNTTSFTTTFYKPKGEIQEEDIKGLTIETEYGTYELDTPDRINWVMDNLLVSQFTTERCFIYNKAMSEAKPFKKPDGGFVDNMEMFNKIRKWAYDRNLYEKGDAKTQLIKLYEEAGELSQATLKNDREGVIDAIGDCVVVLTNLAHLNGLRIETCIQSAYDEISNRTGEMINGTFVKNS